ncbi:HAD family hydrolase [Clostridium sardiniense]|uniref:HAD family hydrolase n=1 Tax=Clostridium sardiniense TaxID=29369 RepID=UPI003D3442C9
MGNFNGYILVSDMDGTLLNDKRVISDEDKKSIQYFMDNGGLFTIATGRMLPSASRFARELNLSLPIILYNGSKVYDYSKEEIIKEYFLEEERKDVINKILNSRSDIGIEVYSEEDIYIFKDCKYTKRFTGKGYNVIYDINEDVWKKKWTKILVVGDKEVLDEIEEEFKEKYDSEIPIRSGDNFLEVVPRYTSKGHALKDLVDDYNLRDLKIVTVGDNMNDKELIEEAHYGFVVNNGNEKLKANTKYIAPSNNDNPITYIVKFMEKI